MHADSYKLFFQNFKFESIISRLSSGPGPVEMSKFDLQFFCKTIRALGIIWSWVIIRSLRPGLNNIKGTWHFRSYCDAGRARGTVSALWSAQPGSKPEHQHWKLHSVLGPILACISKVLTFDLIHFGWRVSYGVENYSRNQEHQKWVSSPQL